MDKKQLAQLAGSLTVSCKEAVQKSKGKLYTTPVLLTTLTILTTIENETSKFPRGWLDSG